MKRTFAVIVAILGLTFLASAQPKAVGVRIGNGIDLSYEQCLGGLNFLEFEGGLAVTMETTSISMESTTL